MLLAHLSVWRTSLLSSNTKSGRLRFPKCRCWGGSTLAPLNIPKRTHLKGLAKTKRITATTQERHSTLHSSTTKGPPSTSNRAATVLHFPTITAYRTGKTANQRHNYHSSDSKLATLQKSKRSSRMLNRVAVHSA